MTPESRLRVREMLQYSICDDWFPVRYDFAYRDPASGWMIQYIVEVIVTQNDLAYRDERAVPPAKATIATYLKRKCGLKLAIENQIPLVLPTGVNARYV